MAHRLGHRDPHRALQRIGVVDAEALGLAEARAVIAEALRTLDFGRRERVVRVNAIGSPDFEADLAAAIDVLFVRNGRAKRAGVVALVDASQPVKRPWWRFRPPDS